MNFLLFYLLRILSLLSFIFMVLVIFLFVFNNSSHDYIINRNNNPYYLESINDNLFGCYENDAIFYDTVKVDENRWSIVPVGGKEWNRIFPKYTGMRNYTLNDMYLYSQLNGFTKIDHKNQIFFILVNEEELGQNSTHRYVQLKRIDLCKFPNVNNFDKCILSDVEYSDYILQKPLSLSEVAQELCSPLME